MNDPTFGKAARFEIRAGDAPSFGGGERSELQEPGITGGRDGETFRYEFAVEFDSQFPMNHADLGWELINQFDSQPRGCCHYSAGMSTTGTGTGRCNCKGYVVDLPLNRGVWQQMKMRVHYSADDTKGALQVWFNANPAFNSGASRPPVPHPVLQQCDCQLPRGLLPEADGPHRCGLSRWVPRR